MFGNNIPAADSDEQTMLDEGKRMGLDPEDLTGERELEPTAMSPNPFELTGSKKTDKNPPADPEAKKQPEKKPEADEEEKEKKDAKKPDEQSDEDEGDDEKSPESKKAITRGEFGKFTRGLKKEMADNFGKLSEAIKTFAQAKTPEKKEEAAAAVTDQVDAIQEYAQKYKDEKGNPLDATALKEMFAVFEKMMMSKIPLEQLNKLKEITPVVETMSQSIQKDQAATEFNNNWEEVQPGLAKQYPNAKPDQWKKAKAILKELKDSEQYKAYPLSHIAVIESEKIKDVLFSPKRKTAETGQMAEGADENTGDDLSNMQYEDMTPKKAAALTDMLNDDGEYS